MGFKRPEVQTFSPRPWKKSLNYCVLGLFLYFSNALIIETSNNSFSKFFSYCLCILFVFRYHACGELVAKWAAGKYPKDKYITIDGNLAQSNFQCPFFWPSAIAYWFGSRQSGVLNSVHKSISKLRRSSLRFDYYAYVKMKYNLNYI